MQETDTKAWVRFRYPRWMYDGPAICGIPVEASRGFMKGWYAQNGVSLKNPRLGYVCVSEDLTVQFGFCGYFKEYDHDLAPRNACSSHRMVPPIRSDTASPPDAQWSEERLTKAGISNGILPQWRPGRGITAGAYRDRSESGAPDGISSTNTGRCQGASTAMADAASSWEPPSGMASHALRHQIGAPRQFIRRVAHCTGTSGDDRDDLLSC